MNKKTLSLKMNKSWQPPPADTPFTPVDQTMRTPVDPPNHASYFPPPPAPGNQASSFYSNPQCGDSDDVLTDVDEPGSKVMRNYSVLFTPLFDLLVMGIYSHILSLPTTTPFLGTVPPSGLVSRVANETIHSLIKNTGDETAPPPLYDLQCILNHDHLKSHAYQPIILQLIRKRLLDLCQVLQSRSASSALPQVTCVQVAVACGPACSSFSSNLHSSAAALIYNNLGIRQLSISNLLLNEQNVANFQSPQLAQVAALNNSRLRLSSLNLRKHSLTRNNSYSGSNWLHVGNVQNVRPNALGMNPEFAASNESLQLMHDYVPQAFISRLGNLLANLALTVGNWGPQPGFNSMMLDYQTPPSSAKSSILLGSTPPSVIANRDGINISGPVEYDEFTQLLMRSRSSSRGNGAGLFPKPLTINTDASNFLLSMNSQHGAAFGNGYGGQNAMALDALNSPFVSATTPSEEVGYFGAYNPGLGNVLPGLNGLRSGPLIPESPGKDTPMANGNNKINLPGQFSLSEKKRDSLKLKRGIH